MLDMFASEGHFIDHLAAVWNALPEDARGSFMVRAHTGADSTPLVNRAFSHGIKATTSFPPDGPAVLTASVGDLSGSYRQGRRRLAIMEHGAGQTYAGAPGSAARGPSYAGGYGRRASLFLHPNERAAARDRMFYRHSRVEVVGAPFLDTMPARDPGPGPVIACTFHFEATVAPEARPAFSYYREAIAALAKDYRVIGTGHPRIVERLIPWYLAHGIEVVPDFREVLRRADLLLFDNTSAGFAFAASGRPVVVLDAPFYRLRVEHGLRFWECVGGASGTGPARLGVRISRQRDLRAAVDLALLDTTEAKEARERALSIVYTYRTGAAARAASVLLDWLPTAAVAA